MDAHSILHLYAVNTHTITVDGKGWLHAQCPCCGPIRPSVRKQKAKMLVASWVDGGSALLIRCLRKINGKHCEFRSVLHPVNAEHPLRWVKYSDPIPVKETRICSYVKGDMRESPWASGAEERHREKAAKMNERFGPGSFWVETRAVMVDPVTRTTQVVAA